MFDRFSKDFRCPFGYGHSASIPGVPQSHIPIACAAIVANTGKAGLNLERGEGEKRAGGGKRRVSILDGWKIHRTSIQINFGHAVAIGDVII